MDPPSGMEELCSSPCLFFTTKLLLLSRAASCSQINKMQTAFRWSY